MDVRPLCYSDLQTRQFLLNEVVLPFFQCRFCNESFSLFSELLHVVYVVLKWPNEKRRKKGMRTTKYRAKILEIAHLCIYRHLFQESNCFLQTGHLLGQAAFTIPLIQILQGNKDEANKVASLKQLFRKQNQKVSRFPRSQITH